MHKLLKRQLKKLGYEGGALKEEDFQKFLEMVDTTYKEADEDRAFLEYTLETSSAEMAELYEELKQKSQTELAKSEQKYKELATKDMLTGIPNRYAFENALKRIISTSKRTNSKFALLFIDLDNFKDMNDIYGHHIGDKLLQEVAKRVLSHIRLEDVFARLGGDEFVLIFTNIDTEKLNSLVGKILHIFRDPWVIGGMQFYITASIGVVVFPDDADNEKDLLINADKAMYKSKQEGRDKVSYFDGTF